MAPDGEAFDWFDPLTASIEAQPVTTGGRGSAWYVTVKGVRGVLRLYRRGGWLASFNKSLYLWLGDSRARSFHEYRVLSDLSREGLPVPKPIGAMVCRVGGFFYRAGLITERIDAFTTLAGSDAQSVWRTVGQTIARMHNLGVWHADLNVHNVLVQSPQSVWLIDFDKARTSVYSQHKLDLNLARLLRSIRKVCPQHEDRLWPVLQQGYRELRLIA
jgi:3-deoxy-D-manno-octulosonic acid kinase